jgi:hypothetical protein
LGFDINESQKGIPTGQAKITGNRSLAEKVLGKADMQKMEVDHSDLIKRINSVTEVTDDGWPQIQDLGDPNQRFKDADRRAGHRRYEFTVKVKSLVSFTKKLFGKEKT